jgi:hypothetical protein
VNVTVQYASPVADALPVRKGGVEACKTTVKEVRNYTVSIDPHSLLYDHFLNLSPSMMMIM